MPISMRLEPVLADHPLELRLASEVLEQSDFEIGRAEMAEGLTSSALMQALGGLDLDDELAVQDHIERLSSEWPAFEVDHQADHPCDSQIFGPHVSPERCSVDGFAISEPSARWILKNEPITARVSRSSIRTLCRDISGPRSRC
jgi:hypothetical protein